MNTISEDLTGKNVEDLTLECQSRWLCRSSLEAYRMNNPESYIEILIDDGRDRPNARVKLTFHNAAELQDWLGRALTDD